jgi:uncharacterized membrane protein YfcA
VLTFSLISFGIILVLVELQLEKSAPIQVKESIYEFVKSVSSLALIATTVALIKALIYWKNTSKKDFKVLFLESIISIIVGSFLGILCNRYINADYGPIAAAVTATIGSRITDIFDQILKISIGGFKKKVDVIAGKDEDETES